MKRVLLVADHPSLHRGFATVGRKIAGALQASGGWDVHYLGRFHDGAAPEPLPYAVHPSKLHDPDDELGQRTFATLVARLLQDLPAGQRTLLVLALGPVGDQAPLVRAALAVGLRSRIHFAAHVAVDHVPLPRERARFFRAVDTVIPYSAAGQRAIACCCREGGVPLEQPLTPIAHGVDVSVFRPLPDEARAAARAAYFGVAGDDLVVGYFGRNSRHKRVDLALAIFRLFAQGCYGTCNRCSRTTQDAFDPTTYGYRPARGCRHCGAPGLETARRRPEARLYVHAEVLSPAEQLVSGGWDVEELVRRMGLGSQVILNRDLAVGRGVEEPELAARMAACDVHLLPYEGGGWELTVLETGACGVPNVITDYATPPDYARPFAECVPVAAYQARRRGELVAIIDQEAAVGALARLADAPDRRAALGLEGVRVASQYAWERLGDEWLDLLGGIDVSRASSPRGLSVVAPFLGATARAGLR